MDAPRRFRRVVVAGAILLLAGCHGSPTYPKARLIESLRELLTLDHVELTAARLIDRTLAVQFSHPQTLMEVEGQYGLGPAFSDAIDKAQTAIHRVVLSSDAQVDFYVLLIGDPATPGVYITLVRYVDDVRRAYWNMLGTSEMLSRTIFDLNYLGPEPMTIEQYVPREIHLEEFLSWQLARRIQTTLEKAFETSGDVLVGRCGGEFQEGEFVFTLNVAPTMESPLSDAHVRTLFDESTGVIAQVLSSYHFEGFDAVRLVHPQTGRNLVLPKTRLSPVQ